MAGVGGGSKVLWLVMVGISDYQTCQAVQEEGESGWRTSFYVDTEQQDKLCRQVPRSKAFACKTRKKDENDCF